MLLRTVIAGLACLAVTSRVSAEDGRPDVAIIKQINRVNEDGTYTFGYEAADGSFKIETRDVLGNIKGMFGYIDQNGELKRVSYSASNGTGFQTSGGYHKEASTRKPILVYRGNNQVVQHIPRRDETTPTYDYSRPTEKPPLRVLVTRRPIDKTNNVIRRQLGRSRDTQDVYSGSDVSRNFRYPPILAPDPREIYRNMLLEQNNLKPDYPRVPYYPPVEEDYPEVPAVVPMVNRVLASRRYRPAVIDEQVYPVPRRLPHYPRPQYDPYINIDYEALREEIMNYLIQYLQYRQRRLQYHQPRYDDYYYQPPPIPRQPYYRPPLPPQAPAQIPYPYVNPNVQYSQPDQVSQQQEQISQLKQRMDAHDHRDTSDTRPPSPALIRMLLARPATTRPAVRSVEILGTSATTAATSTTTEPTDTMVASS